MTEVAKEQLEVEETEQVENKEQDQPKTAEDVARSGGWKPQDEWEGDPAEWRSAEVFNERGEWIDRHKKQQKQIDEMQSTFNTRMDNANKLHQQQIELQKADLIRKRDDAIDLADKGAANGYQDDIDKLNTQPTAVDGQSTLDSWNSSNPWILQNNPKAAYAKQQFGMYQGQGMSSDAALSNMENDVNREFPDINPGRERQPTSEGGSRPGNKRGASKMTWSELTNDELKYYRAMPEAWKSKAEYLQAVQDTKGES